MIFDLLFWEDERKWGFSVSEKIYGWLRYQYRNSSINFSNLNSFVDNITITRSPVNAVNLDSTTGSFLRDKVMTSEPSDILVLTSRKILSALSQNTIGIRRKSQNYEHALYFYKSDQLIEETIKTGRVGLTIDIVKSFISEDKLRQVTEENYTKASLPHQPENTILFQYCSSTPVQHMPCIHPCIFYSKDLLVYLCSPRLNQWPTRSVEIMHIQNRKNRD